MIKFDFEYDFKLRLTINSDFRYDFIFYSKNNFYSVSASVFVSVIDVRTEIRFFLNQFFDLLFISLYFYLNSKYELILLKSFLIF